MNRDTQNRGTPSARQESMRGPGESRSLDDRLHDIDPRTRGEFVSDHQRDRDSKGVAGGYDDSIARRKGEDDRDRLGIARGD
jgi:hypothetical protein